MDARSKTTYILDMDKAKAELCKRKFSYFVKEFWPEIIAEDLIWNWHMDVLCDEAQEAVERVFRREEKEYDLLINVPPGTSKSTIITVMLPAWMWTRDGSIKTISGSYSAELSREHSDLSRDVIKSEKYHRYFPDLQVRVDKDTKGKYSSNKKGQRFSTSVGGTVTGMHGHVLIIDDPLNPKKAASEPELKTANNWMGRTLSTRKVNKKVTLTILIMQRLSENDPSGVLIEQMNLGKKKVRHICLPGEIFDKKSRESVRPQELVEKYTKGMLDANRMNKDVLKELEADLGQYGYAGQIQQAPAPPEGGMFKTAKFNIVPYPPAHMIVQQVRYWDKAGTDAKDNPGSAHTAGVRMALLNNGRWCVLDVKRGQWGTDQREEEMRQVAQLDGQEVPIWIEQEPGSGGKDSALGTIKNLVGWSVHAERPTGDKVFRADPYSVQVNWGQVDLAEGAWNHDYIDEARHFPFSKWKDQIDASSGAFSKLALTAKKAGTWGR